MIKIQDTIAAALIRGRGDAFLLEFVFASPNVEFTTRGIVWYSGALWSLLRDMLSLYFISKCVSLEGHYDQN